MFSISLLCPSKNRPDRLQKMWESALETADNPQSIELVVYVEHYDQETLNKIDYLKSIYNNQIKLLIGYNEEVYSNLHNICFSHASADIVMGAADDIIFRTKNWDRLINKIFSISKDKIMYVYPDDGHWGQKLGTHGFYHKNWFKTLGYMAPAIFTVDYSDNYVTELAKKINRAVYVEKILVEHMHYTFGKSEIDKTAIEAHERRLKTNNNMIYNSDITFNKMKQDIEKLKKFMESFNE